MRMLETCLVDPILISSKSKSIWLLLKSRKPTKMHPKMGVWKMMFPFKEVMFRCHFSFLGSRSTQLLHLDRIVKFSKQICFKCMNSRTTWRQICLCYVLCICECHTHEIMKSCLTSHEINKAQSPLPIRMIQPTKTGEPSYPKHLSGIFCCRCAQLIYNHIYI